MPRQDVPYGGAICRLRERIAEIFDKLGEKLHTINGVPGDGDGNVKIVSGSSAVVISNDPTQNEIAVSLDTSQLPTAAVSSVNGQTGTVALDAGDIPTVGGSGDVQADLQDLASDISGNTAAINAEVLARQGADSTLQTNINSANSAISGKVSKLTTAGDYAYTHSGSTDGEIAVVDGTTADTLPIRDSNGRLQAEDPASGATDKTLTTANWISQTGNSSPNNIMHRNGAETIYDDKTFYASGFKDFRIRTGRIGSSSTINLCGVSFFDGNGVRSGQLYVSYNADHTTSLTLLVLNSDGTEKRLEILKGDII